LDRNRILYIGLPAFAFVLPISTFVAVRILLLVLVAAFFVPNAFNGFLVRWIRRSWDLLLYLVVLAIGLIYSEDKQSGMGTLETNVCFLGMSIVVACQADFTATLRNVILRWATLGICVSGLICIVNAVYRFSMSGDTDVFFFYQFTDIIGSHPTYTAYYIIFSITFILVGYGAGSRLKAWHVMVLVFFNFLILVLTGGITAFVSLLLVVSFFILQYFNDEKAPKRGWLAILCGMILVCMLFASTYREEFTSVSDDSWERFSLWRSAIDANTDVLWGVGTGDYKKELNEYFHQRGMVEFEAGSYNAHNEFIQMYFSNGLLGLVAFVLMLARPLYMSVRRNNALGVLVFFSFIIYAMTEVFLGRLQGVAFYALMHQTFISFYDASDPTPALKG
jgi:O-antigen ligase